MPKHDYDWQIATLSTSFYNSYPYSQYPEIAGKESRPYANLLIDTHSDFLICVPYRSHIHHPNSYLFNSSKRSQQDSSGLDYSKMVIVTNPKFIDATPATLDTDEYVETVRNMGQIVDDVSDYLTKYIGHITGTHLMHHREFDRKYKFSTLSYFHNELGI